MPRKQFLADLEELIATETGKKSDEDGTIIIATDTGVNCTLIFLSLSDYPNSPVLVTTEDSLLAEQLSTLEIVSGTISEVLGKINGEGNENKDLGSDSEDTDMDSSDMDSDSDFVPALDVYRWWRFPFAKAKLPNSVMRAMNISNTDHLLMCGKTTSDAEPFHTRFFSIADSMGVTSEDVKSLFDETTTGTMVNYRKLYFERTLIDYATEKQSATDTSWKLLTSQIEKRLQRLHTSCVVCHRPFKEALEVVKPTVCTQEFCQYRLVEYGLGADVLYEVRHSPYIVDMLIQFTHAASVSKDVLTLEPFPHGICDRLSKFDVAAIIEKMPAVITMQEWVDRGTLISNLNNIDTRLYPLLRWILCTNTSFVEEIENLHEQVVGIPSRFKQFRISSSSLSKEAAFRHARKEHAVNDKSLYAFHGSGVQNWHSILRNGLHYKKVTNARAYGNGIYHALDTGTATSYSRVQNRLWENAALVIGSCFTMNELVNCPSQFVSTKPYLVVDNVDWVQLRYIFVAKKDEIVTTYCAREYVTRDYLNLAMELRSEASNVVHIPTLNVSKKVDSLMTEPVFATPFASKTIMRDIMNFTKSAPTWLEFHPESVENLYRWNVHLKDFDPKIPLATDLSRHKLTGITLELCFGPNYPIAPPFIRIVTPRMLQFCHGGGGHVTAGGSICMDLLTDSGWLPSYTLESVLLQVKMALHSLDPKPARLDPNAYNKSYSRYESWEAFTRVARDHGWKVDSNGRNFYI